MEKTLEERGMRAACAYVQKKGYEILQSEPGKGWDGIVAVDGDELVFASVLVTELGKGGELGFAVDPKSRAARELEAVQWLAGAGEDVVDKPFRYDEISITVVGEGKAALRHHVNCFGYGE